MPDSPHPREFSEFGKMHEEASSIMLKTDFNRTSPDQSLKGGKPQNMPASAPRTMALGKPEDEDKEDRNTAFRHQSGLEWS